MPTVFPCVSALSTSPKRLSIDYLEDYKGAQQQLEEEAESKPADLCCSGCSPRPGHPSCCNKLNDLSRGEFRRYAIRCRHLPLETKRFSKSTTLIFHPASCINPYPTAFPYGNGMVLHFYQQQESSTTKTVHKIINKRLKTYA